MLVMLAVEAVEAIIEPLRLLAFAYLTAHPAINKTMRDLELVHRTFHRRIFGQHVTLIGKLKCIFSAMEHLT